MEKIGSSFDVYVSIGSNLGNRKKNIMDACQLIQERVGKIELSSQVYENPAKEFESENLFYNLCLKISTTLSPEDLVSCTQGIEKQIGRKEKASMSYESRVIDIDILYYDQVVLETEILTLPHPKIQERKFVLVPLMDIAPKFIDVKLQKTIAELLANCEDDSILIQTPNAIIF
ncbi:MAG: 2-amino-4-hydroxy-6-hydroxymethyldihydropteridine diphosphokinase [Flavobacteriia bacterium]|nr:2-amino-4-hydroxy-6-hydroxymethyldihydropteridine diphosphokinase [Flavobacteriia bacterium]